MHISVFKFVSVVNSNSLKNTGQEKHTPSKHTSIYTIRETHIKTRDKPKKFCLLVLKCCFSGMSNFLHTVRLTRLKMSEIILTGCKTQIIIIIKTVTAQLKVHINTTTVAKYDNNKYVKPEKL